MFCPLCAERESGPLGWEDRKTIGTLERRIEALRQRDDEVAAVVIRAREDVIAELKARP